MGKAIRDSQKIIDPLFTLEITGIAHSYSSNFLKQWDHLVFGKLLQSRDEYDSLLKSLKNTPSNLEIQENMRTIRELAGYAPKK